jgi:hypothetical protein
MATEYERLLRRQLAAMSLPPKAVAAAALPAVQQDEPVRASKAAYLLMNENGVSFAALNRGRSYGPQSVAQCHCNDRSMWHSLTFTGIYPPDYGGPPAEYHEKPTPTSKCGFYAWKPGVPFPWQAGTWLLETDLYGTVIEHEHGWRAQKQRVLSISPVPGLACDSPSGLVLSGEGRITAACPSCPPGSGHPVSVERLRAILGVEIDLGRAWRMREKGLAP